jgi:phospholipid/cholesterol/gamma-HCH transport system substrate-binding protein
MKGTFSTEMKVGIFALLVLGVLTYMTFMVSGREWFRKQGYHVYVYFSNTAGLEERSKVKIAGVEAGLIDSIELEGSVAKVRLLIYPEIRLYRDTVAVIKSTGLLGDKYLELRPGSEPPVLRDGDMIRRKIEPTDIDQMIQKLAHISDSFSSLATNFNDIFGS